MLKKELKSGWERCMIVKVYIHEEIPGKGSCLDVDLCNNLEVLLAGEHRAQIQPLDYAFLKYLEKIYLRS